METKQIRIGGKTNQKDQRKEISPLYPWKCRLRIKTKTMVDYVMLKEIKQRSIINEIEISKVKLNVLLINNI